MMIKRILILLGVVLVIGFVLGYLYIYQDHRDIESEEAAYVLNAVDLAKAFSEDAEKASEKFLNETLQIDGEITEIEVKGLTLNAVVYATFDTILDDTKHTLNEKIKLKGRCIGYDELLEVVKLDQVVIIQ